jgi:inner membrane protein
MGYIIFQATASPARTCPWQRLAFYLFAANAPDLDFIPGFLMGAPDRYHHGISHSLGAAVLFASIFSLFLPLLKYHATGRYFAIALSLYCSHIVLDYFSIDNSPPYGQPIFWPFTTAYYIAPITFLPDVKRISSSTLGFITSLFSLHNLFAMTVEVLLLLPITLLQLVLRRKAHALAARKNVPDEPSN